VEQLVDPDGLKARTAEAFKLRGGHLEGMKQPSPVEVLIDLRAYLRNAWAKESKPIRSENKRFVVRFGPEGRACKDVLQYVGFTLEVRAWTSFHTTICHLADGSWVA
jgi:ubiquitin carboxyl-terminal hydrolase 25/28